MNFNKKWLFAFILLLLSSACFRHDPVRHLSSDASLLIPGQTTKQEVLTFMGEPDERRVLLNEHEIWIYYQVKKSLLRKAPYVGDRLGTEEYDVMSVSFADDKVKTCVFRLYSEEEFKQGGKAR